MVIAVFRDYECIGVANCTGTRSEVIVRFMRRNRFDEIMKYVHSVDNNNFCLDGIFAKILLLPNDSHEKFLDLKQFLDR